jgi:hypothetical protein
MMAAEHLRSSWIADIEHRDDRLLPLVHRPGHHDQPVAVEEQLVAAGNHRERGHYPGGRDLHDAHPVLARCEHVRAVGLDDVALVDPDLLGVGAGVVDTFHHRGGRRRLPTIRAGGGCLGHGARHVTHRPRERPPHRPAAQAPGSHPLERLGLQIAEQVGAVAEEREPRLAEPSGRQAVRNGKRVGSAAPGRRRLRCSVGIVGEAAGEDHRRAGEGGEDRGTSGHTPFDVVRAGTVPAGRMITSGSGRTPCCSRPSSACRRDA